MRGKRLRNCKTLILGIILLLFTVSSITFASTWNIQTVDSEGRVGERNSIALDSNNYPHISYYDYNRRDLKYARWNGTSWDIETVDSEGSVGEYNSIALDSSNYPHISYFDSWHRGLKYARWDGISWDIETVDTYYVGEWTSIALDNNNYPHISYYDVINGDLKYATTTFLVPDTTPPTVTNLTPPDGSTVTTSIPTISAIVTDEPGGSGVNASSIQLTLDGNIVSL